MYKHKGIMKRGEERTITDNQGTEDMQERGIIQGYETEEEESIIIKGNRESRSSSNSEEFWNLFFETSSEEEPMKTDCQQTKHNIASTSRKVEEQSTKDNEGGIMINSTRAWRDIMDKESSDDDKWNGKDKGNRNEENIKVDGNIKGKKRKTGNFKEIDRTTKKIKGKRSNIR